MMAQVLAVLLHFETLSLILFLIQALQQALSNRLKDLVSGVANPKERALFEDFEHKTEPEVESTSPKGLRRGLPGGLPGGLPQVNALMTWGFA